MSHATLYLRAYRWMLLARVLEEKIASLYRGGMISGGVFLGRGQEALSTAVARLLAVWAGLVAVEMPMQTVPPTQVAVAELAACLELLAAAAL